MAQLAAVRAALPDLDRQRLSAAHRIAVLLGEYPTALVERLTAASFTRLAVPPVPRFAPSEVLGTAAVVMLASTASSSLVQPLFGAWSDRRGALWLLPGGVALAGIGIALAAASPAYWLVLVLVVVSGLGVAAFHPEGSKFAAYASGAKRASGMSLFSVGGNIGYALGPTATTPLVLALGLTGGLLLALPVLGVALGAAARDAVPVELRAQAGHRHRRPAGRIDRERWQCCWA